MTNFKARPIGDIELTYIHKSRIKSDEARLFEAHLKVAKSGHATEFPLRLKATLSAPMIPADGSRATVVTMDIDTTAMLLLHDVQELNHKFTADIRDEEGGPTTYHFYEFKNPEKFGYPGMVAKGPNYQEVYKSAVDYIRSLVLEFAQAEFTHGVANLVSQGRYKGERDHLRRKIRGQVDSAFDDIYYAVQNDGGFFVSRSNEPRLVLNNSWDDEFITMKLSHGKFDPSVDWKNALLSFPAMLPASAMSIREAVLTAETHNWMDTGVMDMMDDKISKSGSLLTRDLADFSNYRDSEFSLYAQAVSDMAKTILQHRGAAKFSSETLTACSYFAGIKPHAPDLQEDVVFATWESPLYDLCNALSEDYEAFNEFLINSKWPLKASPISVITAKFNKLSGRDMLYGLAETTSHSSSPRLEV
jgi:hypothetical protein